MTYHAVIHQNFTEMLRESIDGGCRLQRPERRLRILHSGNPPLVEFGVDPASLGAVGFQFRQPRRREVRRGLLWSFVPLRLFFAFFAAKSDSDERSSGRTGEAAWQTSPAPEHNLGAWALAHTRLGFPRRLGLKPRPRTITQGFKMWFLKTSNSTPVDNAILE